MPSAPTARPNRVPNWAMVLLVFGAAFAAFWPALPGGVLWDDPAHLTPPELQSWSAFWRILTRIGTTQEYYPVLHGAFWVEHRLWGDYLPAYHALNIALHAASSCLLAFILLRLWRPPERPEDNSARILPAGAAWAAGLLFAVHPVAVESVAWITEQKNTLSVFCYLLAALWYLRFDDRRRPWEYVLALGAFCLALGAKTATLTLPPALLVVLWWRHGRIAWKRDVLPLLPWFALSIAAGLVTIHVETNYVGAKGAAYALSLGERLLLAPRIAWFYVGKIVWPDDLIFYYPRWNVSAEALGWWPFLLLTAGVTVVFWAMRRRTRGLLAGWLLFLGVMFPVIGFFNVFAFVFSYVADHFQYMPCFVFLATAVWVVAAGVTRLPERVLPLVRGGCAALVIVLALESRGLSARYRSNATLFEHVIARNPSAWMAHEILGTTYAKAGRGADAIAQFREVIRLKPDHPDAYLGLALEIGKLPGGKDEALPYYEKAIALRERYAEAHYDYAVALMGYPARRAETIQHLRVAAGLQPYFVDAQAMLADLLAKAPETLPEALDRFRMALQFAPDRATTHRLYGDALARASRTAEALAEYETALRLDPQDAMAHFHLADVLVATAGRVGDAVPQYEAALKLDPHLAEAHAHLAMILAREPNRLPDAIMHAEAAVREKPADVEMHNALAILYAQHGDLELARREWTAALQINPQYADARRNLQLLEQMIRQRGQP